MTIELKFYGLRPIDPLQVGEAGLKMQVRGDLPEAKASGFVTVTTILREMLGPAKFGQVVAKLSPPTAALVKVPPLPIQWIPCDRYGELVSTALVHGFGGDEEQLIEMGRRAFFHDLNTLYKLFVRLRSPGWVMERGSKLWLTFNRNNGMLHTKPIGERQCQVTYEKVCAVYPGFWSYQRGCLLAVVKATGYAKATVLFTSGGTASGDATLVVDWSQ